MTERSADPSTGESPAPALQTQPLMDTTLRPGRPHLVVVRTRAAEVPGSATDMITRFWHPRDHQWSENRFDSLEHALRLFVDESGWQLLQQQALDGPAAHELIFEARREDFAGPTTEEILRDLGLRPS